MTTIPPNLHGLPHGIRISDIDGHESILDRMTPRAAYYHVLDQCQRDRIAREFLSAHIDTLMEIADEPFGVVADGLKRKWQDYRDAETRQLVRDGNVPPTD